MSSLWQLFTSRGEAPLPLNTPQSKGQRETERLIDPVSISPDTVRSLQKIMEQEGRRARHNTGALMVVEAETRQLTPRPTSFSDDEDYVRNIFHSPGVRPSQRPGRKSPESDSTNAR